MEALKGGSSTSTGINNTVAIGNAALKNLTVGTGNVAVGYRALTAAGAAASNVAIGNNALLSEVGGGGNVAIGTDVMANQDGGSSASSRNNVGVGANAIHYNVTGTNNTFVGNSAGLGASGQSHSNNTAMGYSSLLSITTGNYNTAIGVQSLDANTVGEGNTALGYQSLSTNIDGDKNTGVGYRALFAHEPGSAGHGKNTAVGYEAGNDVSTGTSNTIIGAEAGNTGTNDLSSGTLNTLIGADTAVSAADAENQTVIGRAAKGQKNNSVTLGNTAVTDVYMNSNGGAKVRAGSMIISSSSAIGATTSSLLVQGSGSEVFAVEGTNGRLFSVNDEMSGSIFSANTVAGIPVIEATSAYEVKLDPNNNGEVEIGTNGLTPLISIDTNAQTFNMTTNSSMTNNVMTLRTQNSSNYASSVLVIQGDRTTTNSSYSLINAFNAAVSGQFIVRDSGNVVNTNNSYGAISDIKLKQDIVDAGSQWDDIKDLKFKKFRWKAQPSGSLMLGLIAQDVEKTSPGLVEEAIDRDDNGNDLGTTTKNVSYSVMQMKAVVALQEALTRIEELEAKVKELESKV